MYVYDILAFAMHTQLGRGVSGSIVASTTESFREIQKPTRLSSNPDFQDDHGTDCPITRGYDMFLKLSRR